MYRFDSFEDFEKSFDSALDKAVEEGFPFDDFDGVALYCIRWRIAYVHGEFDGLMETLTETTKESIMARINEIKEELEIYTEVATKKMEELGLL